jgi:hypothetical protein
MCPITGSRPGRSPPKRLHNGPKLIQPLRRQALPSQSYTRIATSPVTANVASVCTPTAIRESRSDASPSISMPAHKGMSAGTNIRPAPCAVAIRSDQRKRPPEARCHAHPDATATEGLKCRPKNKDHARGGAKLLAIYHAVQNHYGSGDKPNRQRVPERDGQQRKQFAVALGLHWRSRQAFSLFGGDVLSFAGDAVAAPRWMLTLLHAKTTSEIYCVQRCIPMTGQVGASDRPSTSKRHPPTTLAQVNR